MLPHVLALIENSAFNYNHVIIYLPFNRGCFEIVLMKNTPRTLGVNSLIKIIVTTWVSLRLLVSLSSTLKHFEIVFKCQLRGIITLPIPYIGHIDK
jgi:hypothetical protein